MRTVLSVVILAGGLLLASGAQADTLYQDLGDRDGVGRILDSAEAIWAADPRISGTFANSNQARRRVELTDQICSLAGGGCVYRGQSMKAVHEGLNIDRRQFNALVEGLQHAMDRQDVPYRTQNRLLALLAPMQRDVVTQ